MKKKDILLDFTSLLDVTLIVIFFFVLFSHLDSQENKARTDEKIEEMEISIQEADEARAQYEELSAQLEQEIETVREANERVGNNVSEILDYNRNQNLKIILDMKTSGWGLRVIHDEEMVAYLEKSNTLAADLISAMETAGYDVEQTVFCDFVFDGTTAGTRSAYRDITACLDEVHAKYKYMYISETDLSIGEE